MWRWRLPNEIKLDRNNWPSICEYWDEEMYVLRSDDKEPVNELLFGLF